MFTLDCDIYCECARGCDVSAWAAGNNRIGSESARRETDRPVSDPGRSCEKSADSDHWLVNQYISINNTYKHNKYIFSLELAFLSGNYV